MHMINMDFRNRETAVDFYEFFMGLVQAILVYCIASLVLCTRETWNFASVKRLSISSSSSYGFGSGYNLFSSIACTMLLLNFESVKRLSMSTSSFFWEVIV